MKFKNLRNYSFKSIGCIFSSLPVITLYRSQQLVEQRHADSSLFLSSLWTHHETHGLLRNDQELRTSPRSACAPPPMSYVWNEGSRRNYLKLVRTAHHNVTSGHHPIYPPIFQNIHIISYCFFYNAMPASVAINNMCIPVTLTAYFLQRHFGRLPNTHFE